MANYPLVSIIIVNWNGGSVLKDCITSLQSLTYPHWELVLVDNGSTDGSQHLTGIKKYTLIQNDRNVGFAPANNQALTSCHGEFVLLLNNDTRVTPDFLTLLVDHLLASPQIGVIQPKIKLMDRHDHLDNAGSFFTRIGFLDHWGFLALDSPEFNRPKQIFSAKGACLLTRTSLIRRLGLFDPDFVSYFEESDFCWRVWLAGYEVWYYPASMIYHKVGFTIKRQNVLDINTHYYKNRITSLIKNLQWFNLPLVLIPHLLISLGLALLFTLRSKPTNGRMIIQAIGYNLTHLAPILAKRRLVQSQRQVSDHVIFYQVSSPINWSKFLSDFKRVEQDIETS